MTGETSGETKRNIMVLSELMLKNKARNFTLNGEEKGKNWTLKPSLFYWLVNVLQLRCSLLNFLILSGESLLIYRSHSAKCTFPYNKTKWNCLQRNDSRKWDKKHFTVGKCAYTFVRSQKDRFQETKLPKVVTLHIYSRQYMWNCSTNCHALLYQWRNYY